MPFLGSLGNTVANGIGPAVLYSAADPGAIGAGKLWSDGTTVKVRDQANTGWLAVTGATYTDEQAQDAVGAMVDGSLTYVDATPLLQRAALTGDVTASAGSNATTIANGVVTEAKLSLSDNTTANASTSAHGLLKKLSNIATEYMSGTGVYSTPAGSGIPATIVDAKGDLIAATAADTVARLAVGTNGQVLTADSAEATGLKWAAVSSGASAIDTLCMTAAGWWESTRIPVVADNTALNHWPDATSFGRGARQTVGARPTYQTNEINTTLPAVRFDGSNDQFALAAVMGANNGFSAFIVAKQNSQAQFGSVLCGSSNSTLDIQFKQTSGKMAIVNANVAERLAQTSTPSAGYHLWEAHFDGEAAHEIVMDGTSDGTATVSANYGDVINMGYNQATNSQFLNADLVLVVYFTRLLGSTDRTTMRDYVETTYGLTIA